MNEELIEFIEEILSRGEITENDKKLIFEKSEELEVSQDECEIVLDSLIQKHQIEEGEEPVQQITQSTQNNSSSSISTTKIILGILFYPYGLYLLYQWYKQKNS